MKKISLLLILFIFYLVGLSGCNFNFGEEKRPDYGATIYHELTEVASLEARKCFNFFWGTQNNNANSAGYGLIPDRYPYENGLASIASVGFGLTAFPIGIENGWITYEEGYDRSLMTLKQMQKLTTYKGFYYHFYGYHNGKPANGSEVSGIDTALFIAGALFAGQYFGGEVEDIANDIYEKVEWPTYVNPQNNRFYMSCKPKEDGTALYEGAWDWYGEQLIMYFLGAGSPTHPIGIEVYKSFSKLTQYYGDYEVISSWFGSIFTYQFSHAWIDFRNINDYLDINWYDNSVQATLAHHQYCVDNKDKYKTFGDLSWGLTACDGPKEYSGLYGAAPNGGMSDDDAAVNDGTIALCGAIGSLPFAPKLVLDTMDYYYTTLDGKLFGGYGFYDSYNLENGTWIGTDYIGIDKGISLLMIENYRSELVWEVFMDLKCIDKAIEVLEFTKTK